jgi:hypothetical protein
MHAMSDQQDNNTVNFVPTSLSNRRAPALEWYLGLAILTTILIINNVSYAPSLNMSVGIATPTFDSSVEAGKVLTYEGNVSIARWQQSLSTEDAIKAEEAKLKKQPKSRPEVVIKLEAQEPERTCPDGSKGPSFTSLRVSFSRLLCLDNRITCFCSVHAPQMVDWFKKSYPLQYV